VTETIARSRPRHHRDYGKRKVEFDPDALRYHVYYLYDAEGRLLYIGRSCDPLGRLRAHHANADWASQVASIDGHGPYTWAEVVRREREEILSKRPPHNIDGVTKNTGRTFERVVGS
jgi:hypothetical protein